MTEATEVPLRTLRAGQHARVRVWHRASATINTVLESDDLLFEAPNWTADGTVVLNGEGKLWTMPPDGSTAPRQIDTPGLPDVNNDHVLSPDGIAVFASANDWHIWEVPLAGGPSRRVTGDDGGLHFLHGVRPTARSSPTCGSTRRATAGGHRRPSTPWRSTVAATPP